ncbi:DUF7537 family lipoprotein [Halorarius halobius]|uniref:DUF7537 family lipoprotein n=1 Tax=Halorarius halobius TaxID=2962671 RepID=UPI0020CBAA0E|nr:hypothetical protein [Halorarius halobius]
MRSRTLAALAVASMLLLAGCSFGGTGSPTPTTDSPTPSPSAPSFSYPAGFQSGGVANVTAAAAGHREALTTASGFTVVYDATVTTPNATSYVTYDQEVETSSREVIRRTNVTSEQVSGTVVRYYEDGRVYVKSNQPGTNETVYGNQSQRYELSSFTGVDFIGPGLRGASYGSSEVERRNGELVAVYSDATLESTEGLFGRGISMENVTSFSATLVVDEEGRIHEFQYSATVQQGDAERSVEVTIVSEGVGDTTVDAPTWVSKA